MSEKFSVIKTNTGNFVFDGEKLLTSYEVADLLNQLNDENEQLRQQLKQKQEEERLYANEILELRKTNEEFMQFKELGGDY